MIYGLFAIIGLLRFAIQSWMYSRWFLIFKHSLHLCSWFCTQNSILIFIVPTNVFTPILCQIRIIQWSATKKVYSQWSQKRVLSLWFSQRSSTTGIHFVATTVIQCLRTKCVHKRGIGADYLHENISSDMGQDSILVFVQIIWVMMYAICACPVLFMCIFHISLGTLHISIDLSL